MKNLVHLVLAFIVLSALPANVFAGDISIENAWIRTMPAGAKIAAGYLDISNLGNAADVLVSAKVENAARAEIHRMTIDGNGVMRMRAVPEGIEIAPGETVNLAPGALHLMIMGVMEPYAPGGEIEIELTFEVAGTLAAMFVVGDGPGVSNGMSMQEHSTND